MRLLGGRGRRAHRYRRGGAWKTGGVAMVVVRCSGG
jgi:hypothetical protein